MRITLNTRNNFGINSRGIFEVDDNSYRILENDYAIRRLDKKAIFHKVEFHMIKSKVYVFHIFKVNNVIRVLRIFKTRLIK